MLEVMRRPLPVDVDSSTDTPQLHAFNIVMTLFKSSALAIPSLAFLTDFIKVAIEGNAM